MAKRTDYPEGVPCWIDLQTTDQKGAKVFYGQLFGWELDDQPIPMGGTYTMAALEGGSVAGIGSQPPELAEAGVPPMWNTYLAVDDLDATLSKVEPAGGQVVMPAMDVMSQGRMAMVTDPTGGVVGLWQAGDHRGAETVNAPGSLLWNELLTDEPAQAAEFLQAVLGMSRQVSDMGGGPYTVFMVGERGVCGAMPHPGEGIPAAWTVYFGTDDIEATKAKATELGGTVLNSVDSPAGPLAVIADPQGAVFQVMQPTEWPD